MIHIYVYVHVEFPTGVENMEGGGGGSSQYMKGEHEELKTLLKNTCEGVHLLVKLPAKSLQI